MKLTARQRNKFLRLIRNGHSATAAAADSGLPLSIVDNAEMQDDIKDAMRTGLALLESRRTELAIVGNDVREISAIVQERKSELNTDHGISSIVRLVIEDSGKCQHCGKPRAEPVGETRKIKKLSDPPAPPPETRGNGNNGAETPPARRTFGASLPYPVHNPAHNYE